MTSRNLSRLEQDASRSWLRGLSAVVLVLISLGTLTILTLRWVPHSTRVYVTLGFVWIMGAAALVFVRHRLLEGMRDGV